MRSGRMGFQAGVFIEVPKCDRQATQALSNRLQFSKRYKFFGLGSIRKFNRGVRMFLEISDEIASLLYKSRIHGLCEDIRWRVFVGGRGEERNRKISSMGPKDRGNAEFSRHRV